MLILNYGSEVWGFCQSNTIVRVHLQFCKRLLGQWGKNKLIQNDFVYGELRITDCLIKRYSMIVKYCFKLLSAQENKYIKLIYNVMLQEYS